MCQGKCTPAACQGACSPSEAQLRQALHDIEALARQHLTLVDGTTNTLTPAQTALKVIATRAADGLRPAPQLSLADKIRQARAERPHTFLVTPRLIKRRADDGPISGQAVTDRMVQICGCNGRYDCDCVSCENQARIELWTEHNTKNKEAA